MEVQFGPNSEDEPKLLYKLQRKLKVFKENSLPNRGYNLIACSSKYALIFVASPDGILSVYYVKDLIDKECESPPHRSLKMQENPTHISVNCDFEYLAVTGGQFLNIYNIPNFQNQNVQPSVSIRCDVNPGTFVSSLQWNPCIPDTIALAFFDGTLLVSQVNTIQVKKIQTNARCVCWSPKGKQLVVGNSDGTLCQYKPDLTPAKTVPAPDLFNQQKHVEVLAVHWISTYQFAVVYRNLSGDGRPVFAIVNTPKAGQPLCLNYDDVCYSSGNNRPWYYYLFGVAQWNMILVSSSNSMEIATLGSVDGNNWTQWCQIDEARAELPLSDKKQESYPVGLCFDYSAIHQLPWGENETLPYMPLLHVVSHTGLLTIFNVVNLKCDGQICIPPKKIILPAESLIVTELPSETVQIKQQQPPAPESSTLEKFDSQESQLIPTSVSGGQPQVVQNNAKLKDSNSAVPSVETSATVKISTFSKVQQPSADPAFMVKPEVKTQEIKNNVPEHDLKQSNVQTTQLPVSKAQVAQSISQELKTNDLKLDQKKAAATLDQELKTMLIKEVNDFQMELYQFMQKVHSSNVQVSQDLKLIESNPDLQFMTGEKFKQECCLEELKAAVVQLKRELVRSCAVVAEAHSHAGAKDIYMWNQTDPLSNKKMESIKKLIYYVQNQLDQAHRALNYKWNEILDDSVSKKSVPHMIRPILEDVYQPLVKQQEILSRQEAVLKTFRSTLNECELLPTWKSKSLLRGTPFRNKDPLSKLTKTILNMSMDNRTNMNEPKLSPQKIDALKDMLANHKTVKIKPVNMELHQHFNAMKISYDKNLKENFAAEEKVLAELRNNIKHTTPRRATGPYSVRDTHKDELNNKSGSKDGNVENTRKETVPQLTAAPYASKGSYVENINYESASDEKVYPELRNNAIPTMPQPTFVPYKEKEREETSVQTLPKPASPFSTKVPVSSSPSTVNSQSVLKSLLMNKDPNTFMGQKICSPTPTVAGAVNKISLSTTFSGNQSASGIFSQNNKFSMGQGAAPKIQSNIKSAETGEPEDFPKDSSVNQSLPFSIQTANENKTPSSVNAFSIKSEPKVNKPLFSISGIKPLGTSQTNNQNVPDILNSNNVMPLFGHTSNTTAVENKPSTTVSDLKFNQQTNVTNDNEQPTYSQFTNKSIDAKPVVMTPETKQNLQSQPEKVSTLPITKLDVLTKLPESPQVSASNEIETITTASCDISTSTNTNVSEVKLEAPKISTEITSSTASTLFASANASAPKSPPTLGANGTSQGSIFGSGTATQASNIFAAANAKTPLSMSAAFSVPTVTSTPSPLSTNTSIFGAPVTSSQALPSTPPSSTTIQTKELDVSSVTSQSQTADPPITVQATALNKTVTSAPTSPTVFTGVVSPTPLFGSKSSATQPIVFGGPDAVNPQKSMPATPTTSAAPVFNNSISTSSSIFASPAKTTQLSLFGTSTATTAASIFGSTTTQTSMFGTPSSKTTQSLFGTPITTTTSVKSIFGASPTTTQSSIFGSSTPTTTQSSIFGTSSPTTTSGTPLFGMPESNLFAAASISPKSASSQPSAGNIFGGSGNATNVFGGAAGAGNVFGSTASFSQPNSAASIFGGQSAFGQQQQQQTNLWGGGNTTSAFGSGFGQPNQTPSVFGCSGAFSSGTGQAFGSPTPAGNQSPVFGTPQQTSTFGGSPVFGGKSAFGQSASFGGSPPGGGVGANAFGSFGGFNKSPSSGFGAPATFGGVSTFGSTSPGKAFGGGSPGFGATTQSNATFENLATQNTLTFGNLAQQSAQQSAPAFSNSPAFTGWRG